MELSSLRQSIARYERILGPDPTAAEDVQHLAAKLEQAENDKRSLQLQLSESEAATNALYTEIDGLSGLYEALDRKVKSKCFELKDNEMKTQRLITEVSLLGFSEMGSLSSIANKCRKPRRTTSTLRQCERKTYRMPRRKQHKERWTVRTSFWRRLRKPKRAFKASSLRRNRQLRNSRLP